MSIIPKVPSFLILSLFLAGCSSESETLPVEKEEVQIEEEKEVEEEAEYVGPELTSFAGKSVLIAAESNGVFYLKAKEHNGILALNAASGQFNLPLDYEFVAYNTQLQINDVAQIALAYTRADPEQGVSKSTVTSLSLETGEVIKTKSFGKSIVDVFLTDSFVSIAGENDIEFFDPNLESAFTVSLDEFDVEFAPEILGWDKVNKQLRYSLVEFDNETATSISININDDFSDANLSAQSGEGNNGDSFLLLPSYSVSISKTSGEVKGSLSSESIYKIESTIAEVKSVSYHPEFGLVTLHNNDNNNNNNNNNAKDFFNIHTVNISDFKAVDVTTSDNRVYYGNILGVSSSESGAWSIALNDTGLNVLDITEASLADNDEDGIPNWWEDFYSLDSNDASDADTDLDNDGLSQAQEFVFLSNPNSADSDNDGLSDTDEHDLYQSSPFKTDSDSDNLSDIDEATTHKTSLISSDSDTDQFTDFEEVSVFNTDPNNAESVPAMSLVYSQNFDSEELDGQWPAYDPDDGVYSGHSIYRECGAWNFEEVAAANEGEPANGSINSFIRKDWCSEITFTRELGYGFLTLEARVVTESSDMLNVYIDGEKVLSIGNTEAKEFKIRTKAGQQQITFKLDSEEGDIEAWILNFELEQFESSD
ncbi:hypothetical protein [Psychrosphaera haliotis]|uniref:Uncharacterized protein n=1 Tax=Psychrosphaera haliotis TaxID=555083 RepID=A0A6N8F515_9GAMM|nr:hypothetical protein [Psychrosphaera haliotis]MUH71373.1 hypothetical protein [Psychrosphaera haliotis]